jgi:uncharacterized protein YjbJ (UPF0337 family)
MNKDHVNGAIDKLVGGAKRVAGDLTGNTQLQVEGIAQQVKGNLENVLGNAKDVVREANEQSRVERDPTV